MVCIFELLTELTKVNLRNELLAAVSQKFVVRPARRTHDPYFWKLKNLAPSRKQSIQII